MGMVDIPKVPIDQLYIADYLGLIGIVILYYEYILTFGDEVTYMWPKCKQGHIPWLFFANRYFSVFTGIVAIVESFISHNSSIESCKIYHSIREYIYVIASLIAITVLCLRTFALYERSYWILALITGVALPLIGVAIWAIVSKTTGEIDVQFGCTVAADKDSNTRLAVTWEALVAYDLLIFSLTVIKTKCTARYQVGRGVLESIAHVILRDGALYFAVMACANIANTLTFYILPLELGGSLTVFASSISVTLISRLSINLYKEAMIDVEYSDSTTEHTTALEFENVHHDALEMTQDTMAYSNNIRFTRSIPGDDFCNSDQSCEP
ncbi:hypothetical protein C8Q75DRAFT_613859 [Abortiporus biennis]|nr:hypothetical protein C8Q75DRAFT_613859 [Abortiporus biennis]